MLLSCLVKVVNGFGVCFTSVLTVVMCRCVSSRVLTEPEADCGYPVLSVSVLFSKNGALVKLDC